MKSMLLTDVKRFMDYILKKSYALQLINTLIIVGLCFYCHAEFIKIENKMSEYNTSTAKKIDHRYFNLTRSLEDIHNVRIDTLNGSKRD